MKTLLIFALCIQFQTFFGTDTFVHASNSCQSTSTTDSCVDIESEPSESTSSESTSSTLTESLSESSCENYDHHQKQQSSYQTLELILAEDYYTLDKTLPKVISQIKKRNGHRCWHKHSTFLEHLLGVHNILRLWDQSKIVARVGLLHSAYSNSYVNLALFDPLKDVERSNMKQMIGEDAEELVYLFCIIDRQSVVVDTILHQGYIPEFLVVPHIRNENETVYLSKETLRLLVVFTMADVADQYFGWQDRLFGGLEEENSMLLPNDSADPDDFSMHDSMALWPGSSKPGLWMSYVSELGAVLKTYYDNQANNGEDNGEDNDGDNDGDNTSDSDGNDSSIKVNENVNIIPPIFDKCTQTLSREDEAKARDLYWSVVMDDVIPQSSQNIIHTLQKASTFNPWFFESHVMLAQKYLHINDHENAKIAAKRALDLQYMWGTSYDKRMSFPAWVAWTRVLYDRACNGLGWPSNSWEVNNFGMVK